MSERCPNPKCGAAGGHHPLCSLAPPQYKASQSEAFYKRWIHSVYERERLAGQVAFWQGKHAILKLENNALRKKLKAKC